MQFTQEELDKHHLGFDNIKKIIENWDSIYPQGWVVVIVADVDNSILLKYLTKNGFKKDSFFKRVNPKWRYFEIDEDKSISQLSPEDYIELQNHIELGEYNLIFASKLLGLNSKLTLLEQGNLISILPNQDINNILKKLK